MTLRDRIERAQKAFSLSAIEMAAGLRITPEWLSKIMNGHVEGSDNIGLRLDEFVRQRGVEPSSLAKVEGTSTHVAETPAGYGPAATLRAEIQRFIALSIQAAGDDVGKLGWLREQLRSHFAPPPHWRSVEITPDDHLKAIADVTGKKIKRRSESQSSPAKTQEGAG